MNDSDVYDKMVLINFCAHADGAPHVGWVGGG